jgi:hypothetical protein
MISSPNLSGRFSSNFSSRSAVSDASIGKYLNNSAIRTNLLVMALSWTSGSFNSFLICFLLKYFPGDIYVNTLTSASSDIAASVFSGILYNRIGPKRALALFFGLAGAAGVAIVFYEH